MARPTLKPLPIGGGVNLLQDQRFIRDDQVTLSRNLVPTRSGMVAKRGALAVEANANGTAISMGGDGASSAFKLILAPLNFGGGFMLNITDPSFTTGWSYFELREGDGSGRLVDVTFSGTPLRKNATLIYNGQVFALATYGQVIPAATFVVISRPGGGGVIQYTPSAAGRMGVVLYEDSTIENGVNAKGFWFWADEAETATEPNVTAHVAAVYRNRILWADFGPGRENMAVLSDPYIPQLVGADFTAANGRHFLVGARDGDRITAAHEIMLTAVGSPSQSALLILREYSAYLLTGEPNLVADGALVLGDMVISRINVNCGCSSPDTLVNTPYGLLWAGYDDVWLFPQGQGVPFAVGTYLRSRLQGAPPDKRYLWHAAYANGFYRLALFAPGQGPSDISPCVEQWWLDLRDGAPKSAAEARWYGPMIYQMPNAAGAYDRTGTYAMAVETRPGREPLLYTIVRDGVTGGQILATVDSDSARDGEGATDLVTFGHLTPGYIADTEVTFELASKEYDFGDPMVDKGYTHSELNVWASKPAQVTMTDLIDGGRSSASTSEQIPNPGFALDVGETDTDLLTREFQSLALNTDSGTRPTGKTHQFTFSDAAGYVVAEDVNDELAFVHNAAPFAASLTPGLYDTKEELLDHIVAQMLAASGIVFTHDQTGAGLQNPATITAASGTWTTNSAGAVSRKMWGMLGFDTETAPVAALAQTAPTIIPLRDAAQLEFGALFASVYPIKRRPD